jgi:hypothetical protein
MGVWSYGYEPVGQPGGDGFMEADDDDFEGARGMFGSVGRQPLGARLRSGGL